MVLARLLAALAVGALAAGLLPAPAQGHGLLPAPPGTDPMRPGQLYRGDFPDPSVLRARGRWYAYATSTDGRHLPVLVSKDLVRWRVPRGGPADAMPRLPRWAKTKADGSGMNWAPSVVKAGRHRYVAAYSTQMPRRKLRMCLSLATSRSPRGPFVDRGKRPLLCPRRGVIDPQLLREQGRWWLLYKTDDNAVGKRARIWIQAIDLRRRRLLGTPTLLLTAAERWEGLVVENPSMIRYAGQHYLLYSGNGYASRRYSVAYARCAGLLGPCERETRLIRTDGTRTGPGGGEAFVARDGTLRVAYHAWDAGFRRYPRSDACRKKPRGCAQRRLHVATLTVAPGGTLVVGSLGR